MKVELISGTQNPIEVMYTAARTCYSAKSPIEIYENLYSDETIIERNWEEEKEKKWKLVKQVLDSGHQSIAEHVSMSFAIEGISRACSHQLVRHRAGIVFSQQSQRYVEIKESADEVRDCIEGMFFKKGDTPEKCEEYENKLTQICDKYFVDVNEENVSEYSHTLYWYLKKVKQGMKPEDARNFLPNATKTNIVMTVNLRELIHICNLRLCTRAQKEIRTLFKLIAEEVAEKYNARIADYLVPQCEIDGICREHKCCGRKPTMNEIQLIYKAFKEDIISQEDYDNIVKDIKNVSVNEKLKQLIQMESVLEEQC